MRKPHRKGGGDSVGLVPYDPGVELIPQLLHLSLSIKEKLVNSPHKDIVFFRGGAEKGLMQFKYLSYLYSRIIQLPALDGPAFSQPALPLLPRRIGVNYSIALGFVHVCVSFGLRR